MELVARKAVLDKLKAAAGLSSVTAWYVDIAKSGAVEPYGIISHMAGGPDNRQGVVLADLRYLVKVVHSKRLTADQLAEQVRQALHEQTLTGDSDWYVYWCRQISVVTYTEIDAQVPFAHCGGIYRVDLSQ